MAEEYERLWNVPHCLGALDGKHVVLQAPKNSGSEFYNYKHTFSIVLFAVVDANYNFVFVDAGCQGRISDGGVFKNSQLNKKLEKGELSLPPAEQLNGRHRSIPYFFIGDDAFALTENVMKPFPGTPLKGTPQRIYNYRICRARRVVENVFGIASSVFRVLRKPILLEPEKAQLIVMAVAHLHNFLRKRPSSVNIYTPPGTFDYESDGLLTEGNWRQPDHDMTSFLPIRNLPRRACRTAQEMREELAEYFCNEGRVEWQDEYA